MSTPFELVGLLTHALVLLLGLCGLIGLIPLARGRRAGAGLLLMAGFMALAVMEPRCQLGLMGATAYTVAFLAALWLLLGPDHGSPNIAAPDARTCPRHCGTCHPSTFHSSGDQGIKINGG